MGRGIKTYNIDINTTWIIIINNGLLFGWEAEQRYNVSLNILKARLGPSIAVVERKQ